MYHAQEREVKKCYVLPLMPTTGFSQKIALSSSQYLGLRYLTYFQAHIVTTSSERAKLDLYGKYIMSKQQQKKKKKKRLGLSAWEGKPLATEGNAPLVPPRRYWPACFTSPRTRRTIKKGLALALRGNLCPCQSTGNCDV